jgi:hypothetical protein
MTVIDMVTWFQFPTFKLLYEVPIMMLPFMMYQAPIYEVAALTRNIGVTDN